MSDEPENRDDDVKTDLVELENQLNDAFEAAMDNKDYYSSGNAGFLQSIGPIAQAILETRRQRHIEEGRGEMYQTRHNINKSQTRSVNKRPGQ